MAPPSPFLSKKRKKKDLLSPPVAISITHSCILPPKCVAYMFVSRSLETHMRPPSAMSTPHPPLGVAGIKEIGGVELFSRIRHGQCSLDWTKPPEGTRGEAEWDGNMVAICILGGVVGIHHDVVRLV